MKLHISAFSKVLFKWLLNILETSDKVIYKIIG